VEIAEAENNRVRFAVDALETLTEKQRRRYVLHHAHGLTTRQIAYKEGITHVGAIQSLNQARKK